MCICTIVLDNTDFIVKRDPMFNQLCKQDKSSAAERKIGKYAQMLSIEYLMILMVVFHIFQVSMFSFAYHHRFTKSCHKKCIDCSVFVLAFSFALADILMGVFVLLQVKDGKYCSNYTALWGRVNACITFLMSGGIIVDWYLQKQYMQLLGT